MNDDAERSLRMLALLHLMAYLPCDYTYPKPTGAIGSDRFRRVTNDAWVWPGTKVGTTSIEKGYPGTTCGYVCHWLLWALGCRDGKTINRTDSAWNAAQGSSVAATGGPLIYLNSGNMARVKSDITAKKAGSGGYSPSPAFASVKASDKKAAFIDWVTDKGWTLGRPQMGDVVFISTSSNAKEHVFVFLQEIQEDGKTWWLTADGGQPSVAGVSYKLTCASPELTNNSPSSFMCFNKRRVTFSKSQGVTRAWIGSRKVDGWIDLSRMPVGAWTWDTKSSSGPALDPAVIDVLPQAWSYPSGSDGQQQQAAWQLAAALAVQTFWDWYYVNWANDATFTGWAWAVASALSGAVGAGSEGVGATLPSSSGEIEARQALAKTLLEKLIAEQRTTGTLTLAVDDEDLAISEALADTIDLRLRGGL